jgi:hypothetical protein
MERPAVLVAVAPAALGVVRELLGEEFDLVPVRTLGEALERLARGGIDVILGGLHFDDSLMPILLDAVKAHPATRDIPFVCCRLLPSMLPRTSLRAVRQVCDALGAEAFVDVLEIQQREGAKAAAECLRCALHRGCLGLSAPP